MIQIIYIRETVYSELLIFSVLGLTQVQLTAVNCFKVGTNDYIFGTSELNFYSFEHTFAYFCTLYYLVTLN